MKYAHTVSGCPDSQWEPLDAHLRVVAERAGEFAAAFGAQDMGRAAGLLHDIGKAGDGVQEYLRASAVGRGPGRGPDHSSAGAVLAARHGPGVLGRLLAYAVAGHHGGLPDGVSDLPRRLQKPVPPDVALWPELEALLSGLPGLPLRLRRRTVGFQVMFFTRMLFSCLVDADSLGTEEFMSPDRAAWRCGYPSLADIRQRLDAHMAGLAAGAKPTAVNALRAEVLAACRERATLAPGLFSLTVPTGGGKTLSSLSFALDHALAHGLRRIIYVIPYTSIIEQSAAVFRKALGDLGPGAVLEHHSNFEWPDEADEGQDTRRARLATENWDAPLVVTTNVQFFESLFASRRSACRKLHNIARSVVVLDEAQMLPTEQLRPCLEALRELCVNYGVSVVLCTATQPALNKEELPDGLDGVREIAPNPEGLYARLRRTRVTDLGPLDDTALAARLAGHDRVLCILNTRAQARLVYALLAGQRGGAGAEGPAGEDGLFHLSASMCPVHRSRQLARIGQRLKDGLPCRVVSTQLVEAGVDLDFPVVYRALAGLDSLAQAAGRCNREGRLPCGEVFVFAPGGRLTPRDRLPPFLVRPVDATRTTLRQHGADPLALAATRAYFQELYWREGQWLDSKGLMARIEEGAGGQSFPFPGVARDMQLIAEYAVPVVIPWDDCAREAAADLEHAEFPARLLRRLQRYTVTLPPRARDALLAAGAARLVTPECAVLENMRLYRDDLGLCPDDPAVWDAEELTV